jgi:hypothetical protein
LLQPFHCSTIVIIKSGIGHLYILLEKFFLSEARGEAKSKTQKKVYYNISTKNL